LAKKSIDVKRFFLKFVEKIASFVSPANTQNSKHYRTAKNA
jgi:hypothetical protein